MDEITCENCHGWKSTAKALALQLARMRDALGDAVKAMADARDFVSHCYDFEMGSESALTVRDILAFEVDKAESTLTTPVPRADVVAAAVEVARLARDGNDHGAYCTAVSAYCDAVQREFTDAAKGMDEITCGNCRGWKSTAKDLGDERQESVRLLDEERKACNLRLFGQPRSAAPSRICQQCIGRGLVSYEEPTYGGTTTQTCGRCKGRGAAK